MNKSAVGLIPTRMQSARLPGKALLPIRGLPMIVHVFKRAEMAKSLDAVYVVTDSSEIADTVTRYGGRVLMTRSDHQNGTTRIAEAASKLDNRYAIYVDIQGDEPFTDPDHVDRVTDYHLKNKMLHQIVIPTLPMNLEEARSQHVVKVVKGTRGNIVYMTRSLAPFNFRQSVVWQKHLSIITFTYGGLQQFTTLPPSYLEDTEGIELLRALDHGMWIGTMELQGDSFSIDVPEHYELAKERMQTDQLFQKYGYWIAGPDHQAVNI